ncbi:DUF547 domain-containing protein [uncultured Algibacter sp.]|uniref:DUF547 domain-containing protein n=1 Tax=uncultured Algibacter sp. TaxID=298659 RepID=UPI002626D6B2|nr:DUF547 domain-containing protein [uncultured Algibacter sp.]
MKYLQILIIILLIISCKSTKRVTVTSSNTHKTETQEIVKDTIKVSVNSEVENTVSKTEAPESIQINPVIKEEEEELSTLNHRDWTVLLQKHVSDQGNVNYLGFKNDRKALLAYIRDLGKNIPVSTWSKQEKLAYWINAYNAMTIDLILRHYPVESIKDIKKPWDQRFWKLGEKWYNLNEIEHDILRKMDEPRIHFAIVCASFSCPKLENNAFISNTLEAQLTNVTKEFLSDEKRNEISENSIKISKIFQWFSKDFKQNGSLIDFLNQYSDIKISNNTKKDFKDYDWSLNK